MEPAWIDLPRTVDLGVSGSDRASYVPTKALDQQRSGEPLAIRTPSNFRACATMYLPLSTEAPAASAVTTTSQGKSRARSSAIPSIIGADIVITGTVRATGDIQLDGRVDGDVYGASVAIGSSGQIHGKIVANDLMIRGHIKGLIRARNVLL